MEEDMKGKKVFITRQEAQVILGGVLLMKRAEKATKKTLGHFGSKKEKRVFKDAVMTVTAKMDHILEYTK